MSRKTYLSSRRFFATYFSMFEIRASNFALGCTQALAFSFPFLSFPHRCPPPAPEKMRQKYWFNIFRILIQYFQNADSTFFNDWINIFEILIQYFLTFF